jgi:hypothetical protein
MSSSPPAQSEPIVAMPLSSAHPPLVPVRLDPAQGSGKTIEGTSTDPAELAGKERMDTKVEEVAIEKSKSCSRECEVKGQWWPCLTTEDELCSMEAEGFLRPGS